MNKLLTNYNRGFSLKSNDFRWIDDSVRLAIADICKALGINTQLPVILYGCEVTVAGTVATVTEGAIFYNDEIWHVYDHTFTVPNPLVGSPQWCFLLTYNADGAKLDKDLNPHQTYEIRSCIGALTSIPYPADTFNMSDVERLDNNYSATVLPLVGGVTAMGGDSMVIKSGHLAFIEVGVQVNISALTSTIIARIPEGLRPSRTIRGICLIRASTATINNIAAWSIIADGSVLIEKLNEETGTWNIYFSSELFRIV